MLTDLSIFLYSHLPFIRGLHPFIPVPWLDRDSVAPYRKHTQQKHQRKFYDDEMNFNEKDETSLMSFFSTSCNLFHLLYFLVH